MQPPPPSMMSGMMMDRKRMIVAGGIVFGLFLLFVGAILVNMSNAAHLPPCVGGATTGCETQDQAIARENLGLVLGPIFAHIGMFFFIIGLIAAALMLEDLDVFVRLFLLIVAFVAVLMVLANSPTLFG